MKYLIEAWGTSPIPPGLLEFYARSTKVKGSTPERAVWLTLRLYLLSRGQPLNLYTDTLEKLVARAKLV
jgi:hypothetical protein